MQSPPTATTAASTLIGVSFCLMPSMHSACLKRLHHVKYSLVGMSAIGSIADRQNMEKRGDCGSVAFVHDAQMEVVQIVESRTKVLLLLGGALVFVAGYAFLPDPDHELPTWGGWFFGLCAVVFVILLLRPRKLTLDRDGFSVSGGLARKALKTGWGDVTGFFPVRIRAGVSMVGFDYSPDAASKPRGAWVAKRISGAAGGISGAWPCSTVDLATQLNDFRDRALARR